MDLWPWLSFPFLRAPQQSLPCTIHMDYLPLHNVNIHADKLSFCTSVQIKPMKHQQYYQFSSCHSHPPNAPYYFPSPSGIDACASTPATYLLSPLNFSPAWIFILSLFQCSISPTPLPSNWVLTPTLPPPSIYPGLYILEWIFKESHNILLSNPSTYNLPHSQPLSTPCHNLPWSSNSLIYPCERTCCKTFPINLNSLSFTSLVNNLNYTAYT